MKRVSRTRLETLTSPVLLPEVALARVVGGVVKESKWCMTPPADQDDIFRLDDH